MEFQLSYFKSYKMIMHSICQQICKTWQWSQDWKRSVFIPVPKKRHCQRMFKLPTITLISHASRVMLKILQARLQQYMNQELPHAQAGLEKAGEIETSCQHPLDHRKSKRIPEKKSISASLTMLKLLTVWITTNCGKFFKRWEYQAALPAS